MEQAHLKNSLKRFFSSCAATHHVIEETEKNELLLDRELLYIAMHERSLFLIYNS